MDRRTDAMINAALIVLGAAAVIDTVVVHWLLNWHRLVDWLDDPLLLFLEVLVVFIGVVLLVVGVWREAQARALE